jgi:UDP-N-acetylglucosamine 2-epimerase (non-hydrolysing)
MYLVCYGTRPEALKLLPLWKELGSSCKILFTGQHPDITKDIIDSPDYKLEIPRGQPLDILGAHILLKVSHIISEFDTIIVQGDTISAFICALSAFHNNKRLVHVEAGLRTFDKTSPFPEESYRCMISKMADYHFCPTDNARCNLLQENITKGVYVVGNTIVDTFRDVIPDSRFPYKNYLLVTLHRRENRGSKMLRMWEQLNKIVDYNIVYITHPSLPQAHEHLTCTLIEPQDYPSMVSLIMNSQGIISDSGGLQEEAVCARKKILVCRDTTERPETISSGWGLLIDDNIIDNMSFFDVEMTGCDNIYGENVSKKIVKELVYDC